MPAAAALLPVILFLSVLVLMDSFKLIPVRTVIAALMGGGLAAVGVLWLHAHFMPPDLTPAFVSRYVAPVTEEAAKGALVAILILGGRAGFLVDAGVLGFAIGAGFALVENLLYLRALPDGSLAVWLVRGLGTAMLHGATSAMFAMIARTALQRRRRWPGAVFVPGLLLAVAIHSAANHLLLHPVAQALVVLMILPATVLRVFDRSERATREWVSAGLDLDLEVLQLVVSEQFTVTRYGQYLQELRARFSELVVVDMYCLLRLELELAVQAKAFVMARGAGLDLAADEDLEAALAERAYLKRSIGRTGLLALRPLQVTGHRDQWHRHVLRSR